MDFKFSEEQEAVAESAAAVFGGHATAERVAAVEAGEPVFDREMWAELATANLLGIAVPQEYGGSGLAMIELCILLAEQGRRVAPVPVLSTLVAGALAIAEFGSPEQKSALLPGVVAGNTVLAAALATAGEGVPHQTAVLATDSGAGNSAGNGAGNGAGNSAGHGGRWRLDGICPIVRGATVASLILVPARVAGGSPGSGATSGALGTPGSGATSGALGTPGSGATPGELGIFLVDPSSPGCTVERVWTTDRQEHGSLELSAVMLGDADMLGVVGGFGEPRSGAEILNWICERVTVGLCALQLGVTEEAVSLAAAYVTERQQFGKSLASFQGVALRAADAHIDTEAIAVTMWQAAWRLAEDQGSCSCEVAVAKWWASEAGHRVVHAAQHLHGGLGADVTYPIHRYFLWGKQIELEMGAGARQLAVLGDRLVGAP